MRVVIELCYTKEQWPSSARLSDEPTEELKMAHKVMMLLTSDDPTDGLKMYLSKRATMIMTLIMDIFEDDDAGSFYHAYRVIDLLLRCYPLEVLTSLTSDGNLSGKFMKMLRYIGYPPVMQSYWQCSLPWATCREKVNCFYLVRR